MNWDGTTQHEYKITLINYWMDKAKNLWNRLKMNTETND